MAIDRASSKHLCEWRVDPADIYLLKDDRLPTAQV